MPVAPFGSWPSPVTADALVQGAVRLGDVEVDGDDVWWVEARPGEGGRQAMMRAAGGADPAEEVTPPWFSVRTMVHEYGGRAAAVHRGVLFASNFADQRLWRLAGDADPEPVTPAPPAPMAWRYADPVVSPDGRWVYCVREAHGEGVGGVDGGGVVNEVVRVPAGGGVPEVVATGADFYGAPRLSPDGARLAWVQWRHPDMPWDATELWVAAADGSAPELVAGGPGQSVSVPRWSPDGRLHWVSDRTGWWNLYAEGGVALAPMDAEFAGPDWALGQSSYDFLATGELVATWVTPAGTRLGIVDRDGGGVGREIEHPFTAVASVRAHGDGVVCVAGSFTQAPCVARIPAGGGPVSVLARSRDVDLDAAVVSVPVAVEFPTSGGGVAHALYYPPTNGEWEGPAGERPPLVVMSHGGPTSRASRVLDVRTQWWTSRGIAVVDVDYRGSTGYGRAYREELQGQWGVYDVDDCVHAARWLAEQGLVDPDRVVVRGESASGYTTLCALVSTDAFAAGASHYGVGDLAALARDTHKFESRYLDRLIGPYPEAAERYRERSPVHHLDRLSAPVILFQGLDDKVVPPAQAAAIADVLRAKGIPFACLLFEGEQHGFRQAETVRRVAEAELWFFGRVLGFEPADELAPVPVENEAALPSPARTRPGPRSPRNGQLQK